MFPSDSWTSYLTLRWASAHHEDLAYMEGAAALEIEVKLTDKFPLSPLLHHFSLMMQGIVHYFETIQESPCSVHPDKEIPSHSNLDILLSSLINDQ